jgi:hypothetical protein
MTQNRHSDTNIPFLGKGENLLIVVAKYTFQEDEYHNDSYLWLGTGKLPYIENALSSTELAVIAPGQLIIIGFNLSIL